MKKQIENIIKSTLVIENKQSIGIAVNKIMNLYDSKINDLHDNLILGNTDKANKLLKCLLDLPF